MMLFIIRTILIFSFLAWTSLLALAKTMGTPIGGMGTGYMVFNARSGDFATSGKMMPPASDAESEFINKRSASSGFYFFANGKSTPKAQTDNEDAKCPVYFADFGATGGVDFKLTAFGPFIPGSDAHAQLAQSPLAFFEITATNLGADAADVAVACEFANQNSKGVSLLGGAVSGTATADNKGLTYDTAGAENACILAGCSDESTTFSAGGEGAFTTTGALANGTGNFVAGACSIRGKGAARFKFVFAWWRQFRNATRGPEDYFYHNFYDNSREAAEFGMKHFDAVREGATSIVNRVLATNFPEWYKDRLLNNLYPLIHNSQCAKDGRVGFWEGRYPIIGTLDQGEHASLWYSFNWPSNQWRELQFWARTSHTGSGEDAALKGQVHHDLNVSKDQTWSAETRFMCLWDDYKHDDYSFLSTDHIVTTDWSDLNSMFIFKAYELMLATGDKDSLNKNWRYIKNTADRLITQCGATHLPTNSQSTYAHDGTMSVYASGVALVAWLCVAEMAKFLKDDASAKKYSDWYTAGRAEFSPTFFDTAFGTGKKVSEADVAGYSWARYFGFPAIMDSNVIATGCNRLWAYYKAQPNINTKLGLWHFYTYDHWGGAAIGIGQQDYAMTIHKWDYDFYYTGNPACVFWQDLYDTNTYYSSYMTACCVWRSYFQMTGTLVDNANSRLWIRPMIPASMNHKIENAPIVNAHGWGTLKYDENRSGSVIQTMMVAFDSLVSVKEIVLKNNATIDTPGVLIIKNGASVLVDSVRTEGSGYEKRIRLYPASGFKIGPGDQGVGIKVFNSPVPLGAKRNIRFPAPHQSLSLESTRIASHGPVRFFIDATGPVFVELLGINGAKIGTLFKGRATAGKNAFVLNGRCLEGTRQCFGMAVIRLHSSGGSISRMVFVER
jgi:hypothetical protein